MRTADRLKVGVYAATVRTTRQVGLRSGIHLEKFPRAGGGGL